jgi:hypothetical protein
MSNEQTKDTKGYFKRKLIYIRSQYTTAFFDFFWKNVTFLIGIVFVVYHFSKGA